MRRDQLLAYGLLGLPLAFAALPVYVQVPRYYAETTGMTLSQLGVILLGARLFDAAPGHPGLWLLGALALTYVGFSAATIAHQAWGADMAGDPATRTRLTASREGFGLAGALLAAALPGMLAAAPIVGVARLTWVLPPVLLIAAVVAFTRIKGGEAGAFRPDAVPRAGPRQVWRDVPFRRLLTVFVANGVATALPATLFPFFVADALGAEAASGGLLALYFVAGAVSLPLWVKAAARVGRVAAWGAAMLLAVCAFAGTVLLRHGDAGWFVPIVLVSGLALGADLALPAAIAADLGERRGLAGTYFGVWNFVAKLNLALAAGLALPLLEAFGYRPGGPAGLDALTFAYTAWPLGIKLLAALLLWRWRASLEIRR